MEVETEWVSKEEMEELELAVEAAERERVGTGSVGLTVDVTLLSRQAFVVSGTMESSMWPLSEIIRRGVNQAQWTRKGWVFPVLEYEEVVGWLRGCGVYVMEPPSKYAQAVIRSVRDQERQRKDRLPWDEVRGKLPSTLGDGLKDFQRDGVLWGVQRDGCVLLADAMGLGKTVQAIAISVFYRADWPLLVLCPASMRDEWKVALRRWLPPGVVGEINIHVVCSRLDGGVIDRTSSSTIARDPWDWAPRLDVVIVSYDMVPHVDDALSRVGANCVIVDESHSLKNPETCRYRSCAPLIQNAKRRILLSGTPALGRPAELFTQLSLVSPETFDSFPMFSDRYCGGVAKRHRGADRLPELHALLSVYMKRRVKSDVDYLPPKRRAYVVVEVSASVARSVSTGLEKVRKEAEIADRAGGIRSEPKGMYRHLYLFSGIAKLAGVLLRLQCLLRMHPKKKIVVFANHLQVLNAIESFCIQQQVRLVRIDGHTQVSERQRRIEEFQTQIQTRLAILGLTACGSGITLTKADVILFAELCWVPGLLLQAEDRSHRIGRDGPVDVEYVVAHGTLDDVMWPMIQRKMGVVTRCVDGGESNLAIEDGVAAIVAEEVQRRFVFDLDRKTMGPIETEQSRTKRSTSDHESYVNAKRYAFDDLFHTHQNLSPPEPEVIPRETISGGV